MFPELSFSSTFLLWSLAGFALFLIALIYGSRLLLAKRQDKILKGTSRQAKGFSARTRAKYANVDIENWHSTLLTASLALVMGVTVMAFNWTTQPPEAADEDWVLSIDEDIEIAPPQTTAPPPPPPPPPPPVVTAVPQEVDLDIEDVEFEDMSVDEETVLEIPEKYQEQAAAPPPPPPPPPSPNEPEVEEIFRIAEEMPRFPGCEDEPTKDAKTQCANLKLLEFIYSEIKYPEIARENQVEGTVVVQFVVGRDGRIRNAEILRDVGGGCGKEALRVINLMNEKAGLWIPGRQRGRPVPVMFTLPVKFKLETRP